jgi:hypothetical protein
MLAMNLQAELLSNPPVTRQSLLANSVPVQKELFAELTAENCFNIWMDKMSNILNTGNLDSTQLDLVNSIISNMDSTLYDTDTLNDGNFDSFYITWIASARQHFTVEQFIRAFVMLNDYNDSIPPLMDGGRIPCSCNQKSDWCSLFTNSEKCYNAACEHGKGCGSLWRHPCNGRCTIFGIQLSPRDPNGMY